MSKIDELAKLIVDIIEKKDSKKPRALDTVGTVTRVDGDYAWIRLAGSEEETPVKETITVKKGDKVQVRASKGSAWIVGNETAPPTDDTLAKKAMENSDKAGKAAKRASDMTIINDTLYYLASDQDEGVTVEDEGWTKEPQEITESLPYLWAYHDYERGNGTHFKSDPVIIAMYAEDGKGIDTLTTYYALGTSTTTAPTTGWATSFTYLSGYYIWRKELITYDDGTTKWTTAVYDAGLTQSSSLSYDTAQYFWNKSTGGTTAVPTGSYVTEVSKSSYQSNPSGNALLMNSDGIRLRNGTSTVASFLAAGVKLFNLAGTTLAEFLSDGLRIYDTNGEEVGSFTTGQATIGGASGYNSILADGVMEFRRQTTVKAYLIWALDPAHLTVKIRNSQGETSDTRFEYGEVKMDAKLSPGAINSNLFDVSSVSVSADSGTGNNRTGTATATKTGYYPLAIAGLSVATGGCYSRGAYLTSQASGSCTVNFRAYNGSGTSQAVNATAYVLWVKNTI